MTLKENLLELNIVVDNEYLDKYCELIMCNKHNKKEKFKTQKHHIIPRYYYNYNNLKINDSDENTVHLSHYNHLLAHLLLCKCSTETYLPANEFALNRLLKVGNKEFIIKLDVDLNDDIKIEISKYLEDAMVYRSELTKKQHLDGKVNISGLLEKQFRADGRIFVVNEDEVRHLILPEELDYYMSKGYKKGKYFNKNNNPSFGKSLTDETKQKIAMAHKGKHHPHSEESKKKISEKLKGKSHYWNERSAKTLKSKKYRWWNNGVIEKLSIECPGDNFKLGKLKRPNRHWYNNGIIEVWVEEKPEGFKEGRLYHSRKNIKD